MLYLCVEAAISKSQQKATKQGQGWARNQINNQSISDFLIFILIKQNVK